MGSRFGDDMRRVMSSNVCCLYIDGRCWCVLQMEHTKNYCADHNCEELHREAPRLFLLTRALEIDGQEIASATSEHGLKKTMRPKSRKAKWVNQIVFNQCAYYKPTMGTCVAPKSIAIRQFGC